LGGGTMRGIAKPGEIIWSRVFVSDGKLKMDIGRGRAASLSRAETERRWELTTYQWPMMHGVLYGVSRDQMMARHKANHIQVAYGASAADADRLAIAKGTLAQDLGIEVSWCGTKLSSR
jgi:L-fucose isomerase-like protein